MTALLAEGRASGEDLVQLFEIARYREFQDEPSEQLGVLTRTVG